MPPVEASTRTGSFPAISERPSPPPPPLSGSPEWYAWAAKRIEAAERAAHRALETAETLKDQIGRPPVPASKDAGAGMWLILADVREDCTKILAKLDAADIASASRGGAASRVMWRAVETLIPLAIGWFLLWASGWHR